MDAVAPYLYNENAAPPHQRAAMVLDLLDAAHDVTARGCHGHRRFAAGVARRPLAGAHSPGRARSPSGQTAGRVERPRDADSRAALAYYLFKSALGQLGRAAEPPISLTDDDVRTALDKAAARLAGDFSPRRFSARCSAWEGRAPAARSR